MQMNVKQSFKLALKSILGSKFRSFLTMLGIIIGVAAVIMVVCFALVKSDALATLFDGALGDTGTGTGSGEGTESALRILGL